MRRECIQRVVPAFCDGKSRNYEEQAMKIGILTGGGDCPGLNAVIRAAVRKGSFHYDDQFVGFLEGWRGLVEDKSMPLDLAAVAGGFSSPRPLAAPLAHHPTTK